MNLEPTWEGQVALAALEPHFWQRFCRWAGLEDLLPSAFSPARPDNPAYGRLLARLREHNAWEWKAWAKAEGLPLRAVRGP